MLPVSGCGNAYLRDMPFAPRYCFLGMCYQYDATATHTRTIAMCAWYHFELVAVHLAVHVDNSDTGTGAAP
jgi:hypothetical protein